MSYYKAVFDLGRPIEVKAPEERDIHKKMSVLAIFDDPPVPYSDFLAAIEAQTQAVTDAQNGGRTEIALMRTKEKVVDNMVRKYRSFVSGIADGDTDIILSSGFRHTKPRASAGDMPNVEEVKNLKSELSGALKLKWKAIRNVAFYEVQVREVVAEKPDTGEETPKAAVDSAEEMGWTPISSKPSRIEIKNLKPLTRYEVRVRAKGSKGFGGFSDVVIMVVT